MVAYTPAEVRALTPVREIVEKLAVQPERRDYFLCHAWDDRREPRRNCTINWSHAASRLRGESIADKELSVLLARDQLVPIVHGTTYEALLDVSPMLASRTSLSTAENPMATVAAKLAELVAVSPSSCTKSRSRFYFLRCPPGTPYC